MEIELICIIIVIVVLNTAIQIIGKIKLKIFQILATFGGFIR